MKIEIFPAKYGDCFLVNINKKHILIDCGFESTYDKFLKPRLQKISENDGEAVDLLVVTHLHSDHILGIIKFLKENGSSENPQIIPVKEIWFNGFNHVHLSERINAEPNEYEKELLENIKLQGYLKEEKFEEGTRPISESEAISLTELIIENNYNWNLKLHGNAIVADDYPRISLGSNINLVLLSPIKQSLMDLDKQWHRFLKRKKSNIRITEDELFEQTFEFILSQEQEEIDQKFIPIADKIENLENFIYPFQEDPSIVNKSSIAFIIEYRDQKALFLGDAHSADIENGLYALVEREKYDLNFDIVKIAHHGSEGNTSPQLMEMIEAKRYLISTNGKHPRHEHPDLATIARILSYEDKDNKELIFNYETPNATVAQQYATKLNVQIPRDEQIIVISL